jgi:hypothetical protein
MANPPRPMPAPVQVARIQGYDEFEVDLVKVLKEQLTVFFDGLGAAALNAPNVAAIPERARGAYLLLHQNHPVYAGKTDARHGFRDRLARHASTIQHRRNLDPAAMTFKAVRVMVFSNFDVEEILISEMKARYPGSLTWNTSGFGSNDPGRNRDRQEPSDFSRQYPVDVDRPLTFILPGTFEVSTVLTHLKNNLPYLVRHEKVPAGRTVTFTTPHPTAKQALRAVVTALGAGWQATFLHERVILYRENVDYPFAVETMR